MSEGADSNGERGGPREAPPFVSIILPVRDEAPHIARTLDCLLQADYPPERLEILLIDGASRDATRAIVQALADKDPWNRLRLLENPAGITPAGLNIGIRAARGRFILRMDGHAWPAPDYIRACLRALEQPGAWAVGGRMQGRGETGFGRAVALATAHPVGAGDAAFRIGGEGPVDTVYLGAWPRWVFDRVGLFDEGLPRNQDYELCLRIRAAGGLVWLDPAIRSQSLCRGSLPALARQYFGYGSARVATWRRHPGSLRWRQALPALWVAGLVLGSIAAWLLPSLRMPFLTALAAYALLVLLATLRLSSRAGRDALHLPGVFACIHLAWGLGFWRQLLARGP